MNKIQAKYKMKAVCVDITQLKVDAIVNAANGTLLGGGGVDGAIHAAAGDGLLEECKTLGGCYTGDAKLTHGYNLPAKYVIHTVGPVWSGGGSNEENLLRSCYKRSIDIAKELGLISIAFPSISCGVYGYPIELAHRIAISTVYENIIDYNVIEQVIFACFDQQTLSLYEAAISDIA